MYGVILQSHHRIIVRSLCSYPPLILHLPLPLLLQSFSPQPIPSPRPQPFACSGQEGTQRQPIPTPTAPPRRKVGVIFVIRVTFGGYIMSLCSQSGWSVKLSD